MVTVLLLLLAATIGLAAARGAANNARSQGMRLGIERSVISQEEQLASFEALLTQRPLTFGEGGAATGTFGDITWLGPNAKHPLMARTGDGKVVTSATYRMSGVSTWPWISTGDLLGAHPGNVSVGTTGPVWASGTVEPSLSGGGGGAGAFANTPGGGLWWGPGALDVSTLASRTFSSEVMVELAWSLQSIACPNEVPVWAGSPENTGLATHVCLEPGNDVLGPDGTTWKVPDDAKSYLLDFDGAQPDRVSVYTSTSAFSDPELNHLLCPGASEPVVSYDGGSWVCHLSDHLLTVDDSLRVDRNGPGTFWDVKVGEAVLPETGVIAASGPTTVGACNATASGCQNTSGVAGSVTVVAGTPSSPADIYLGSGLTVSQGVSFAAVATGEVRIPYWAHIVNAGHTSNLSLAAHLVGVGANSDGPSVRHWPELAARAPGDVNWGGNLAVTGGVAGKHLQFGMDGFDMVSYNQDVRAGTTGAPWLWLGGSWARHEVAHRR